MKFNPRKFEKRWQYKWDTDEIYNVDILSNKTKCFVLDMFPYPSGNSMHVGHPRGYVATDVYSRFKRMNNFEVLHPMGWDAFGLPAEETAIKNKEHPSITVSRNINRFKKQLKMLGIGYDWTREINTTDQKYYIHTQRIFLEFFKRGLAISKTAYVNWCPELGTVLANEDIVDGKSERGEFPVFQKNMRQWVLKITKYADRLIDDLELLPEWPEKVKSAQRHWIGRKEGFEIKISTNTGMVIKLFTTELKEISEAEFVVVAPDSTYVKRLIRESKARKEIEDYIVESSKKTELERKMARGKTGVVIQGVTVENPLNRKRMSIVIADYVLCSDSTGAIMAIPSKSKDDAELARVLKLPLSNDFINLKRTFANRPSLESIDDIYKKLLKKISIKRETRYKIRDWVFSRQRFWGEPFPIVWVNGKIAYDRLASSKIKEWIPKRPITKRTGVDILYAVPVAPEYLNEMKLPNVEYYENTSNMEGPLVRINEWVNTYINVETGEISNSKRKPGKWIEAKRETNTMPQWAGSSWYWLRYMDPENAEVPYSKEATKHWGPVDVYAGADHAVAHLIYARFWHKVMQDAGMVDYPEPFKRLEFLGYILSADGTKISKRKGNSRSPEEIIKEVGADTFRMYEMFIGPFEKAVPWSDEGLKGLHRFLGRVWEFSELVIENDSLVTNSESILSINRAVKKVSKDIEKFKFNTAISSIMVCLNEIRGHNITSIDFKRFVQLLAPFAPHIVEEIWEKLGCEYSVHNSKWPEVEKHISCEQVIIPIQINNKIRSKIYVKVDLERDEIEKLALNDEIIKGYIKNRKPKKIIIIPNKIVSIVI